MGQIKKTLILYKPHEMQLAFHSSKKRFRVASYGRQSGKSTACVNELLKKAWETPGSNLWFVSPTYDQAKVQFRRLHGQIFNCKDIIELVNISELRIRLINGSEISFKSGESLDNLRGQTLHGVVVDEVRDQHPDLWGMVLRPMLATTKGWAAFVSTPNGFDQFYDLYTYGKENPEDWDCFQSPSTCNPLITEQELQDAKRTMSEAQFAQEYLAEFRDLTAGKAYINFGEHNLRETNPFWADGPVHPLLPIVVGMDFNLSPMSWVLMQKKIDDFHAFDEIYLKGSHTQEASKVLASKIIELGHQKTGVILSGDATAKAGQRAAAGQSDYDIVCQELDRAGIKWMNMTPESNPSVKDRVNTVNSKLKDGTGAVHFTLNPKKCPMLKRDLERVVWKPGPNAILDQNTNPDLTHLSDAIGYPICALSPLKYDQSLATLRVIRR